jgi:Pvc16 N-terminal domain
MSNSLAIATVTATLSQLIQDEIQVEVPGATVSTVRPDIAGNNSAESKVNVFLYQVTTNASLRNIDLSSRRSDGSLRQKPRGAFDLHYLLTFYGDETTLVPQRLLGSTLRTLHSEPQLTRQRITDTVNSLSYLTGSTLADDPELVKFTLLPLSIEELSKLWSILLSTPYALSIIFLGTVVLIESDEIPIIPRPVQTPQLSVMPFRQPIIDQLLSQKDIDQPRVIHPIVTGDTLILVGRQFQSSDPTITTLVQVGNTQVATKDAGVNRLSFVVPNTLQAGIQSVQVVQQLLLGKPPVPHYGFESNVMPFVLRPTINNVSKANVQGQGGGLFSADLTITLTPQVGPRQRVVLVLNSVAGSATSAAYSFISEARAANTDTLTFSITDVSPATYIVSVQVDGAQSVVDSTSKTVTIP